MYCHHCGKQLPDGAKFCPECGGATANQFTGPTAPQPVPAPQPAPQPMPVQTTGTLKITRRKAVLNSIKTRIYVDDVEMDRIGEGDTAYINLPTGPHKLRIETSGTGKKEDSIMIEPGETTVYMFELNLLASHGHNILSNGIEGTREAEPKASAIDRLINQPQVSANGQRRCPHCGGIMLPQTVTESRKTGCFTILLYVILCLTVLGILIVIPLALRKKTETVTYMVCQQCGRGQRLYSSV